MHRSLTWNVWSHFLNGARVKVELRGGWIGPEGAPLPPTFSEPLGKPRRFEGVAGATPAVILRGRNVGRLPATVTWWQVDIGDNATGPSVPPFQGDPLLPHTLNPGESRDWHADAEHVWRTARVLDENGKKTDPLRASVVLGDGRTAKSPARTRRLAGPPAVLRILRDVAGAAEGPSGQPPPWTPRSLSSVAKETVGKRYGRWRVGGRPGGDAL